MIIHGPSRRGFLRGQLLSRPIAIIGEACLAEADIICRSCEDACPNLPFASVPELASRLRLLSMKPSARDAADAPVRVQAMPSPSGARIEKARHDGRSNRLHFERSGVRAAGTPIGRFAHARRPARRRGPSRWRVEDRHRHGS